MKPRMFLPKEMRNRPNPYASRQEKERLERRRLKNLEMNGVQTEIINSYETLYAFMAKETLDDASIQERVRILNALANDIVDGKRDIKFDLENIPTHTRPGRLEASEIVNSLKQDLDYYQGDTPYSPTYRFVSIAVFVFQLILALLAFLV